jgi:hypothetical protein
MPTDGWMDGCTDKQTAVYVHNGILLSLKKEGTEQERRGGACL